MAGWRDQSSTATLGRQRAQRYRAWRGIKSRCLSPTSHRYKSYGARGITVCARWRDSFVAFLSDVGLRPSSRHSIDRIDNDRGYEPGNVRWATPREQGSNRRDNRRLTLRGETKTVAEWARSVGTNRNLILSRLQRGCEPEAAVFTPSRRPYRWATQRAIGG